MGIRDGGIFGPRSNGDEGGNRMQYCPFEFPVDVTVEVFNYERKKHHQLLDMIWSGTIKLLCDKCIKPVTEQMHEDPSIKPYGAIQVTCNDMACGWTGYRLK